MQRQHHPEAEWGSDESVTADSSDIDDSLEETRDKLSEPRKQIIDRICRASEEHCGCSTSLEKTSAGAAKESRAAGGRSKDRRRKSTAIGALRKEKQERIDLLNTKLQQMDEQINETNAIIAKAKNAIQNALLRQFEHCNNIPRQMKQAEERYTQWVRATYPYVDVFPRAGVGPIRRSPGNVRSGQALSQVDRSVHAHESLEISQRLRFETGQRLEDRAQWKKGSDGRSAGHVRDESALRSQAPPRLNKGHETWTLDTTQGQRSRPRSCSPSSASRNAK